MTMLPPPWLTTQPWAPSEHTELENAKRLAALEGMRAYLDMQIGQLAVHVDSEVAADRDVTIALTVACPACDMPAGQRCLLHPLDSASATRAPHPERAKAYTAWLAARTPLPSEPGLDTLRSANRRPARSSTRRGT